ncbi:hypothetical protein B0I31_11784 [Saccharothrix carnea]|uniref:Uncharacterized protein n=1 Tax=Saccharothrix carnea TaxID=1280637 RepID=A0A2P8I090_SACCR|nr:hypothetical protein [Saccharothrix carnea]PSL51888.1 hypothetical protein B0I31_11784 [Saccharothrix carnea]
MSTHFRSRPKRTWRYALPAVLVTTAVAATLVPAQAVAGVNAATRVEQAEAVLQMTTPDPTRTDPEVLAVTSAASDALEYSIAVVAADPSREYPEGSVESTLRAGLLTLPPAAQREATEAALRMVNADVEARVAEFGQYGRNDWTTHSRLGFARVFQAETLTVDRAALTARLTAQADQLAIAGRAAEQQVHDEARKLGVDPSTIKRVKALALDITSVKCVEETNDWWFEDEIQIGGLTVGSDGVTKKVAPFDVSGNFDSGETVNYGDGGKRFATLDMSQDGVWPRHYWFSVILNEKDNGSFADALTTAWDQVKGYVKTAIEKLVEGVLSPYLGAAIAGAIGKAVAWLVNVFIGWLIKLFKDETFKPQNAHVLLPSNAEFMYTNPIYLGWDNHRTPTMAGTFDGHGGLYYVYANLEVLT